MSHDVVGKSSVALVIALCPPPYGNMSYAATAAVVVMRNALPRPVPCVAASKPVIAGFTPAGQSRLRPMVGMPGCRFKKTIATSPGGICPFGSGVYFVACPDPVGMYENAAGTKACPPYSTVNVTGSSEVFVRNAAKHAPAPSRITSGTTM